MIAWTLKLWRTAGAAAAVGLTACGGEGGENQGEAGEAGERAVHGEAGEAANSVAGGEQGEAAIGESGGEHGEAGVSSAYAGISGDQRTALRLQHLKGFLLVAARVNQSGASDEARVLVQQGLLEVYDPATDQFGALDPASVRAAGAALTGSNLQAAERALDAARPSQTDYAALAVSMVDISTGLYKGVVQDDFIDPVEYQHSLGAALAARDALIAGRQGLRARNARAYDDGLAELDRFAALWPAAAAPARPAAYRDVLAQSSRVRLALSPLL